MGSNARNAAKVAVTVVGVGAGVWISLIVSDLLTFWWTYSTVVDAVELYGLSEYPARMIGVLFAAIVTFIANNILWNVIKRDKKWVPMLAGVMILWFAVMYQVSSPYTTSLFNPFSGEARAVYVKMPNGTIKKYPRTMKYDPDTGQKLEEFDAATAQEYQRQQGRKTRASAFRWKSNSKSDQVESKWESENLVLWAEKVELGSNTIVSLAVQGKGGGEGWLLPNSRIEEYFNPHTQQTYTWAAGEEMMPYLVDDSGRIYRKTGDTAAYDSFQSSRTGFFSSKRTYTPAHHVRKDEIYRFALLFEKLKSDVAHLRLHVYWFKEALELGPLLEEGG
jgi:hypothetical protein